MRDRTRLAAIELLDMAASTPAAVSQIAEAIGAKPYVLKLALAAFCVTPMADENHIHIPWELQIAEAAALLRDGWSPGDPVEYLFDPMDSEVVS